MISESERKILQFRASHHILLAHKLLDKVGGADEILHEENICDNCKQTMVFAAEAHIAMARFKLDYPEVMQNLNRPVV